MIDGVSTRLISKEKINLNLKEFRMEFTFVVSFLPSSVMKFYQLLQLPVKHLMDIKRVR